MVKHEPTWILIRGLAHESGHWGDFVERLSTTLNVKVVAGGFARHGSTSRRHQPDVLTSIADAVRTQTRGQVAPPYTLCALSFGGMVALEWMSRHPDEVASVVLINSSLANLSRFWVRLRWQAWVPFSRAMTLPSPRDRERTIAEVVINDPERRAKALPEWIRIATDRPISYRTVLNQLWAAARAAPRPPVDARGLILNGLGDRLVDPSCSTALAGLAGWPIKRHPWAGHDLAWDDPRGFWTASSSGEGNPIRYRCGPPGRDFVHSGPGLSTKSFTFIQLRPPDIWHPYRRRIGHAAYY